MADFRGPSDPLSLLPSSLLSEPARAFFFRACRFFSAFSGFRACFFFSGLACCCSFFRCFCCRFLDSLLRFLRPFFFSGRLDLPRFRRLRLPSLDDDGLLPCRFLPDFSDEDVDAAALDGDLSRRRFCSDFFFAGFALSAAEELERCVPTMVDSDASLASATATALAERLAPAARFGRAEDVTDCGRALTAATAARALLPLPGSGGPV